MHPDPPTYLWSEQLHADGTASEYVAAIDDWLHNSDEGRSVGELVIENHVHQNVV